MTSAVLVVLAFFLGLRHGIDWDHIAAITDIVGTSDNRKQGLILGLFYILGHAFIIAIFGLLAILIGIKLPNWVDKVMEPIVGLTLIILGIWLLFSILRFGRNFKMKSRWMIIFALIDRIFSFAKKKITHQHPHNFKSNNLKTYGVKTAFGIGMIHGIGAETPTQVLLFIAASGVSGAFTGSLLLLFFIFGLILSNTMITLFSIFGYAATKNNPFLNITLGLTTAIFSLIVGFLFLLNKASFLPAFFGG